MSNEATASPGYVKRRFDWQDDLDVPQKILEIHTLLNKNIFTYGVSKHVLPCCNNVSVYVSMKRSKSVWKIGILTSVFQSLGRNGCSGNGSLDGSGCQASWMKNQAFLRWSFLRLAYFQVITAMVWNTACAFYASVKKESKATSKVTHHTMKNSYWVFFPAPA